MGGNSNAGASASEKPYLVMTAIPAPGHALPVLSILAELAKRHYDITLISGEHHRRKAAAAGVDFVPIAPPDMALHEHRERLLIPAGLPRLLWDWKHVIIAETAARWRIVQDTLLKVHRRCPARPIILVTEIGFVGCNPLSFGAPLPEGLPFRPKVIQLGVSCYSGSSVDTAPFGAALPPDSSESGRLRNELLARLMREGPFADVLAYLAETMEKVGATGYKGDSDPFSVLYTCHDVMLQLCPPSLEYVRSDQPANVKFVGTPLPRPVPKDFTYPDWWSDVTSKGSKKIVTVTQGTVAIEYTDLLVPTIQGLADRDDLLVIAILGRKKANLPDNFTIPPNVRLAGFLSYDAVLPHSDVFVMNAGYGGMLHGMTNGVPMVLAGASEDKPEVSMRAAHAGIAVDLKTGSPTPEQVRAGVDEVLRNPRYKRRVMEVRRENEGMGVIDRVEQQIREFAEDTQRQMRARL